MLLQVFEVEVVSNKEIMLKTMEKMLNLARKCFEMSKDDGN